MNLVYLAGRFVLILISLLDLLLLLVVGVLAFGNQRPGQPALPEIVFLCGFLLTLSILFVTAMMAGLKERHYRRTRRFRRLVLALLSAVAGWQVYCIILSMESRPISKGLDEALPFLLALMVTAIDILVVFRLASVDTRVTLQRSN